MWRSITDIPGLLYTIHPTTGGSFRASPLITLAGDHFVSTFVSGDLGWNNVAVSLDDAGVLTLPCNVRVTLIEKLAAPGGLGGDGALFAGDSFATTMNEALSIISAQTYAAEGVLNAVFDSLAQFNFSGSSEYFESVDFLIEVDGDIPVSAFWTNFVGCGEF